MTDMILVLATIVADCILYNKCGPAANAIGNGRRSSMAGIEVLPYLIAMLPAVLAVAHLLPKLNT